MWQGIDIFSLLQWSCLWHSAFCHFHRQSQNYQRLAPISFLNGMPKPAKSRRANAQRVLIKCANYARCMGELVVLLRVKVDTDRLVRIRVVIVNSAQAMRELVKNNAGSWTSELVNNGPDLPRQNRGQNLCKWQGSLINARTSLCRLIPCCFGGFWKAVHMLFCFIIFQCLFKKVSVSVDAWVLFFLVCIDKKKSKRGFPLLSRTCSCVNERTNILEIFLKWPPATPPIHLHFSLDAQPFNERLKETKWEAKRDEIAALSMRNPN